MDQDAIFKAIQNSVSNTPLILVGSGASAPPWTAKYGNIGAASRSST